MLLPVLNLSGEAVAETHYCNSCDNCTANISNANSGDMVILTNNISHNRICITWVADNITFNCNGNLISGPGASYEIHGIILNDKSENTIKNCKIINWSRGIYLENSSNNTFTNNTLNSNDYGIYLQNSKSNNITGNSTADSNNEAGIYLFNSSENIIDNCSVLKNKKGISLNFSNKNTVKNNLIYNNSIHGMEIEKSGNNTILENEISITALEFHPVTQTRA